MKQILISCLTFIITVSVYAQTGSIDLSFGTNGKGQTKAGLKDIFLVLNTSLQPDGKMLVLARSEFKNPDLNLIVFRIHPDGTLDQSFGKQGVFIYKDSLNDLYPSGIFAESNSQFVICGGADKIGSTADFVFVYKWNADGSFVSDFGQKGKAELTLPGHSYAGLVSIVRHPDGTYYMAGYGRWSEGQLGLVVSLTSKGELNPQFNGKGYLGIADKDNDGLEYLAIALNKTNDALLLTGEQRAEGQTNFVLTKINLNGSIDASFGNQSGHLYISEDSTSLIGRNMLIDGENNIWFAIHESKYQEERSRSNTRIYKCNAQGSLISHFGGLKSFIELNHSTSLESPTTLQIQNDGKILLCGYAAFVNNNFNTTPFTMRFEKDGSLDKTYGNQGLAVIYPQDVSRYKVSLLHPNGYFYHFTNARNGDTVYMVSMRTHTTVKTGIVTIENHGNLKISPNPITNSIFTVTLPEDFKPESELEVSLIDIRGITMLNSSIPALDLKDNRFTMELNSSIPSGLYLIRVSAGKHVLNNAILLQR